MPVRKPKPKKKVGRPKNRSRAGRPPVITDEVLHKLEEAWKIGCSDKEGCFLANISPTALYEYQKRNPEYAERKEVLKKNPTYKARKCVVQGVTYDADLALKYLKAKEKDEFGNKPTVEVSGDVTINVNDVED